MKQNKICLLNTTKIIANSKFIQKLNERLFGLKSTIIYPTFVIQKNLNINLKNRKYITMVHSTSHKGVNLFLKIAKELRNESFCIYGNHPLKKKASNVIFYKWINNSNLIYNRAKLVLIPSIWMEAFCRVAIEAAYNFVPVLSQNRFGLIESNVNGAYINDDINNIDTWLNKIKEILTNPTDYVNKIDLMKFEKFKKKYQIVKFNEVISELLCK